MARVIGLVGYAGSGKSTAAEYLFEMGFAAVKFAAPLKAMLRAIGLSPSEIEGDLKELPCDLLCNQTPRFAMVTLGTEWGRNIIGQDLWLNLYKRKVRDTLTQGRSVVTDDVRFENEVEAVRRMGGKLIKVIRPGLVPNLSHESEQYVDKIKVDHTIMNAGTKHDLPFALQTALKEI